VEVLLVVLEQRLGRLRDEDLTAMPGRSDPRRAMDGKSRVAAVVRDGLARVQAHPDFDLDTVRPPVGEQRELALDCCQERVAGAREGDEEGVALRVDFVAAVSVERLPEQALMVAQDGSVAIPELFHEPRRPLDVREEEGHGARRRLGHGPERDTGIAHKASTACPGRSGRRSDGHRPSTAGLGPSTAGRRQLLSLVGGFDGMTAVHEILGANDRLRGTALRGTNAASR
jgi:hypothetical protein